MKERGFEPVYGAPEDTKLPSRATEHDAGYDFYAPCDIYVGQGMGETIWLNVKAYMKPDEFLSIENRSSMMSKKKTQLFCSGIIDSGYYGNPNNDGNIGICLLNHGSAYEIKKGDKICQGIFHKYLTIDNDNATGKRIGGFGSTGR